MLSKQKKWWEKIACASLEAHVSNVKHQSKGMEYKTSVHTCVLINDLLTVRQISLVDGSVNW